MAMIFGDHGYTTQATLSRLCSMNNRHTALSCEVKGFEHMVACLRSDVLNQYPSRKIARGARVKLKNIQHNQDGGEKLSISDKRELLFLEYAILNILECRRYVNNIGDNYA